MKFYHGTLLLLSLLWSCLGEQHTSSNLLRHSLAHRRVKSATIECKYAKGSIIKNDQDNGQIAMYKHLCVTDSEVNSRLVYTLPNEVVVKLEEDRILNADSPFVIIGAEISGNHGLDDNIVLHPDWSVETLFEGDRRHLQGGDQLVGVGTDTVVVVRVTATDSAVSYSATSLQEIYFGTERASVALQYNLCSAGAYSLVPTAGTNGVVELAWNFPSNGVDVEDSIENSLHETFESAFGSTEDYGHVIYCLPSGFNSFRGYSYSESNEIFIYNEWCGYLSLPFHEVGRNLGLELSNAADGTQFGDRSCMMGLSYSTPFAPRMCFNGHKFWLLNWFSSFQVTVDPTELGATTVDVAAFVDAKKLASSPRSYAVIVKVGDLYLVYNLAKDHNVETKGGANQITITEGPDAKSASRSLGGIDASSTSFSATAALSSGNQAIVIEYCEVNSETLASGVVNAMRISIRLAAQIRTCELAPSAQPSSFPSMSPSILKTAFPTPSAFLCDDTDGTFFVPIIARREPCLWLQSRPEFVPSLCTVGSEARAVCPETCQACTDECTDTRNEFVVDGALRDCEWLRIRPGQQEVSCVVGNDAYAACPETCDACDGRDFPSLSPSVSPSSRPSKLGDTRSPTTTPSVSNVPTVTQTASPSTVACDDDPVQTFFIPSLSRNEPCIWLADRPEFRAELCVQGLPAYDICEETCGKCSDNCNDTNGTFSLADAPRDCEWLRLRAGIQNIVCILGSEASLVCPETCNACEITGSPTMSPAPSIGPFCDDDPSATFPVPSMGTNEPCIWLADRPALQPELCKGPAFDLCPETCGKCIDGCKDTFSTFKFDQVDRDCQWLRIRPGVQEVVCVPGNDAYDKACPETCNACDGERFPSVSPQPSFSPSKTSRPSPIPSSNPSAVINVCDDDPDARFLVGSLGTNEPCVWLADRPQFQQELCVKGNPAYDICEETCGKCSDSCEDTFERFKIGDAERDCQWLRLRNGIQEVVCVEGSDAYKACPETCNACDSPEAPPSSSASPSEPSSSSPSTSPSDPPTTVDKRQGAPRCDDNFEKTFYVASIKETQGCLWLEARPNFQVVLCRPDDPSGAYDICEETCGKCSDDCEDTGGTFDVDNAKRDCAWLHLRPGQQDALCMEGSQVRSICPETCNACDGEPREPCDDTAGDFFVAETGKNEPCIWLRSRLSAIASLCTEGSEASKTCPETCGVCKDDCEDSDTKFMVNGVLRDCEWLEVRPGEQTALCIKGTDAYFACPETCNGSCDQR